MPQIEDLVVRIAADTTQFDKSMSRIQRRLWWLQVQHSVLFGLTIVVAFLMGFVVGINV